MPELQPLVLYYHGPATNPWKVALILEELGLPYKMESVAFSDIKKEPFILLNPNGRLPGLEDPNTNVETWEVSSFLQTRSRGPPIRINPALQSGAIIDYLIDVYDTKAELHYTSSPEKYTTRCWEHFQMSGQGPYFGQKAWFEMYHPEKLPSAIERYGNEIKRVIGVIDEHLRRQGSEYLVGDRATYADIMWIPWFQALGGIAPEIDTTQWEAYTAWYNRLVARPRVAAVLAKYKVEIEKHAASMKK
jgi:glutathione S-transferase